MNLFMEPLVIHCYLMQPPGPEKCNLYYSAELKKVELYGKNTPLILATKTGNIGIVMEILKHGPDIICIQSRFPSRSPDIVYGLIFTRFGE